MRRIFQLKQFRFLPFLLALAVAGLWASSCSKKHGALTEPTDTGAAASSEEAERIQELIDALFPKPNKLHQSATKKFRNIVRQWSRGQEEAARDQMVALVEFTGVRYEEGQLLDPPEFDPPEDTTTEEAVSELISLLFEFVGVDGAAAVVPLEGGTVLVVPEVEVVAGVDVPALDETILVTVQQMLEGEEDPPIPVDLPQFGNLFGFDMYPTIEFDEEGIVGLCVTFELGDLSPEQEDLVQLYRYDPDSGDVYALPLCYAWFLDCLGGGSGASMAKVLQRRGLGGLTQHFSHIRAVLPAQMDLYAGDDQTAQVGTPVPIDPAVLVTDADNDPVKGARVRFVVTGGGGSVDPAVVVTGPDGIASVTWTLGPDPGTNTLEARGVGIAGPGEEPFTEGLVGTGVVTFEAEGVAFATISGTVMYNGEPIAPTYTTNNAAFWARDENTGKSFPISPTYNNTNGMYSIPNVPSGSYGIQVSIDDAEPFDGRHFPGDYVGWKSPIDVGEGVIAVNADLVCQNIIHLTAPIDNLEEQHQPNPYDSWQSPITFEWESIGEASTYRYRIEKYQSDPHERIGVVVITTETADTQADITLDLSADNQHYQFYLYAYNAEEVMVGKILIVYASGHGWDYRFRVIEGGIHHPAKAFFDRKST